jgi:YbgC/YbaW family acyl-CoA thioester hydrolase
MQEQRLHIRWRDVDSYGHVNNAVYLNYLEECRDRWVQRVLGPDTNFVIVRVAIDYRRELSLDDDEVLVTCRGVGYGRSSVRTQERVYANEGWLAAEAESVVVAHDAETRASRALTDGERARLDVAIAADG